MKLTVVTAVFNAIKSGNRENLIRCVRSVAALKTEHEHLIYDGGSTDGTVELLRELEREARVKSSSSRVEWLRSSVDVFVSNASALDRGKCAERITSNWYDVIDSTAIEGMNCIKVPPDENPLTDRRAIKDVFQGFGEVENNADGRRVIFPAKSAGKMLGQSGIDIRRYVRSFADMFRKSIRAWSEKEAVIESHKQHRNITAYHQYIVKADLAGAICYVRFTVREDAGGRVKRNEVHSSTISRVTVYEAKGAELSGLGHAQVEDSAPFVDNKIAFFLKGVKGRKTLRVVSEPDTGIYNALNKGVRDARGEWFYVLGCDDYLGQPEGLDRILAQTGDGVDLIAATTKRESASGLSDFGPFLRNIFWGCPYCHQGVLMRTASVRRFGGFDERYRISADYDLMLKFHTRAARIAYPQGWFAVYGYGGFSETSVDRCNEPLSIAVRHFNLEGRDINLLSRKKTMTVRTCLKFMRHRDRAIRFAARYLLTRRLVWILPRCLLRFLGASFKECPKPIVTFTFDDGTKDYLTHAAYHVKQMLHGRKG